MTPADLFTETATDMRRLAGLTVAPWPPAGLYLDLDTENLTRTAEHIAAWSPDLAVLFAGFLDVLARMYGRWPDHAQRSLIHPALIDLCDTWWTGRGVDPATV